MVSIKTTTTATTTKPKQKRAEVWKKNETVKQIKEYTLFYKILLR